MYENFQNPAVATLDQNIIRFQSVEPNFVVMNNQNQYSFPNAGLNTQTQQAQNQNLLRSLNQLNTTPNLLTPGNTTGDIANLGNVFTGLPDDIGKKLKECRTFTGLTGLSNLMASTNPNASERCGWRYQPGSGPVSIVSQGAFGNANGPLDPANPRVDRVGNGIRYFHNLRDAEKIIVKDICKSATACQDLMAAPLSALGDFSNVCGYCTTSQKIIPITRQGNSVRARYDDIDTQCSPQNIITVNDAATRCPAPDPGAPQAPYVKCLNPGKLDRDCIALAAQFAGCSPKGALVESITTGTNPNDLADKLRNKQSFQAYQSLANPVLNNDMLQSGNATIFAAFANIFNLNASMNRTDTRLRVAAQDLCMESGIYENYNFCTELTDGTRDFELNCMQNEFLRQGGTPQGSEYPKSKAVAGSRTWGEYKKSIADLVRRTNSADPNVQRDSLNKLKGLQLELIPTDLPRGEQNQGVEVFWIESRSQTMLGRRPILSASGSNLPNFNSGNGVVENTGFADNVEFISFFDLRPLSQMRIRWGVVTDDGVIWTLNQDPFNIVDGSRALNRYYPQAPTWHQSECMTLASDGSKMPNINVLTWYERGGGAVFHPSYQNCGVSGRPSWTEIGKKGIPLDGAWKDMCYFTQEIDAPSLSFEVYLRRNRTIFCERRLSSKFMTSSTNGTIVAAGNALNSKVRNALNLQGRTWTLTQPISLTAFRTITFAFSISASDGNMNTSRLFEFGSGANSIVVWIAKRGQRTYNLYFRITAPGNTVSQSAAFVVEENTFYLGAIMLGTPFPTSRQINSAGGIVQKLDEVKRGNLLKGVAPWNYSPGRILYDEFSRNNSFAGRVTLGRNGLTCRIGWLHFFDSTWSVNDPALWKKEANSEWLGRWFE